MSQGGTPVSISANARRDFAAGQQLYELVRQGRSFSGHERNCCFLNMHEGRFADISSASGWDFPDDGRAISRVDWDFDGDLDFWIANRSGPQLRFLRNDVPTQHHFLGLRLVGQTCNRDAIGARVELIVAGAADKAHAEPTRQLRSVRAGDGFLAQSSKWLHFGLGDAAEIDRVIVNWPGGESEEFSGLAVDKHYRLIQGSGRGEVWTPPQAASVLQPSQLVEPSASDKSRVVSLARLPVPRLQYQTFDGSVDEIVDLSPDSGRRPVLLNLWASWCQPCRQELSEWTRQAATLRDAGIDVVALSVDGMDEGDADSRKAAQQLMEEIGFPFASGLAGPRTVEKLQLMHNHLFDAHRPLPVPTSFLIDGDNQLAALYRGPVEVDQIVADAHGLQLDPAERAKQATPFAGRWYYQSRQLSPLDLVWKMTDEGYLDEAIDYLARYRDRLKTHPDFHKLLVLVGNGHLARHEARAAMKLYRQALSIDGDYAEAQNNLAWLLATHPDDAIRNGTDALRYAERANEQRGDTPSMLDTLAAAYAENGQFEEAITTAKKAIKLAQQQSLLELAQRLEQRLTFYENQRPYRDR